MCINAQSIKEQLNTTVLGKNIFLLESVDSTNSYLKNLIEAPAGTLVVASEQTGGRGRRGRSFWSPKGGIYMSLLYKPEGDFNAGKITSCAALAVCEAIEKTTGLIPKIKWVNDVYLSGKKVCGILSEAITNPVTSQIEGVVIGIGVNVEETAVPSELKNILTSLFAECDKAVSKNQLIAEICNRLEPLLEAKNPAKTVDEIRRRSLVLGKTVTVISSLETYEAKALDIGADFSLIVEKEGERINLSSGEITIRNF